VVWCTAFEGLQLAANLETWMHEVVFQRCWTKHWIVELGIRIVQLATDSGRQRMRGWRLVVGIPGITHVSVLLLHQLHQRMCICAYALHKQTFPAQVACVAKELYLKPARDIKLMAGGLYFRPVFVNMYWYSLALLVLGTV
jgi:hypothetical protein